MTAAADFADRLDRAARYYREALKHVLEECGNDKPRIDHIREAAERGIRAADHELETESRYAHDDMPDYPGEPAPADLDRETRGILEGLGMYAWWKDGSQYVGTTGTTLRDARARLLRERGYEVSS